MNESQKIQFTRIPTQGYATFADNYDSKYTGGAYKEEIGQEDRVLSYWLNC